jgi:hypothetical protein
MEASLSACPCAVQHDRELRTVSCVVSQLPTAACTASALLVELLAGRLHVQLLPPDGETLDAWGA